MKTKFKPGDIVEIIDIHERDASFDVAKIILELDESLSLI